MQDSNVDSSPLQQIGDQLEELIVTLFEEIRERPGVAAAILAGIVGAIIGGALAARAGRRKASPPARVARRARDVGDAADLLGLSFRLMQNPIVRGMVVAAVTRQLRRRVPF